MICGQQFVRGPPDKSVKGVGDRRTGRRIKEKVRAGRVVRIGKAGAVILHEPHIGAGFDGVSSLDPGHVIHNVVALLHPRSHRMSLKITQFRTLSPRWSTLARMKKGIGLRAGMLSAFTGTADRKAFPSPVSEESRCALG